MPPDEGINNHKAKSLFGRTFEYDSKQKYSAVYVGPDSITLGNLILALTGLLFNKLHIIINYNF